MRIQIFAFSFLAASFCQENQSVAANCVAVGKNNNATPQFFLRKSTCKADSCTKSVAPGARALDAGKYRIYYLPPVDANVTRGIAIGQVFRKASETGKTFDDSIIDVSRERIDFACTGNKNGRRLLHIVRDRTDRSVKYADFDRWHRFGSPLKGEPFRYFLEQLHVAYDNGVSCTATSDKGKRIRFLFDNRNDVPGIFRQIANGFKSKSPISEAAAASTPSRTLSVNPYNADLGEQECISFDFTHAKNSQTEVRIDDIDRVSVRNNDYENVLFRFKFLETE
jgi:hypothetical protein